MSKAYSWVVQEQVRLRIAADHGERHIDYLAILLHFSRLFYGQLERLAHTTGFSKQIS
jgi:hypothetical protein